MLFQGYTPIAGSSLWHGTSVRIQEWHSEFFITLPSFSSSVWSLSPLCPILHPCRATGDAMEPFFHSIYISLKSLLVNSILAAWQTPSHALKSSCSCFYGEAFPDLARVSHSFLCGPIMACLSHSIYLTELHIFIGKSVSQYGLGLGLAASGRKLKMRVA